MIKWTVGVTARVRKQMRLLPESAKLVLQLLFEDLQNKGANPGQYWSHYSKFRGSKQSVDKRHCHLLKGRPTYVCCWEMLLLERKIKVYYVGTHEKAPY